MAAPTPARSSSCLAPGASCPPPGRPAPSAASRGSPLPPSASPPGGKEQVGSFGSLGPPSPQRRPRGWEQRDPRGSEGWGLRSLFPTPRGPKRQVGQSCLSPRQGRASSRCNGRLRQAYHRSSSWPRGEAPRGSQPERAECVPPPPADAAPALAAAGARPASSLPPSSSLPPPPSSPGLPSGLPRTCSPGGWSLPARWLPAGFGPKGNITCLPRPLGVPFGTPRDREAPDPL